MQGRLSSLEKASTSSSSTFTNSASSKEVVTAELSSDQEGDLDWVRDRHSSRRLQTEDEFFSIHEGSEAKSKRHRSPSPDRKEEELDEDPSYRQFLVTSISFQDIRFKGQKQKETGGSSYVVTSC